VVVKTSLAGSGEINMLARYLTISALALSLGLSVAFAADAPTPQPLTPREAIFKAADAAPAGVAGRFRLTIQATGHQDGHVYLNSETDYRDQRNLSIDLCPVSLASMKDKFAADPETFFVGKTIEVRGVAHRVKITFLSDGKPTDRYYYQTHVRVCSADQISLVGPTT
jgi:hypothetical protein